MTKRDRKLTTLALVFGVLCFEGCSGSDNGLAWPQWRGPGGLGHSAAVDLPVFWDKEGAGIKWSAEVPGSGTSSPIVAGKQVFLTSAEPVGKEVALMVHSFSIDNGEKRWSRKVAQRPPEKLHRLNTSAGATTATDGDYVFAYFGSHLAALDMGGSVVWVEEIHPKYLEESRYGAGSSPVLVGDLVIVQHDREQVREGQQGWIAAYEKATGEEVWKRQWDNTCCSYTTPLVVNGDGTTELVVVLAHRVESLDPLTGARLRRKKSTMTQPVASAVIEDDLLCMATGAHGNREARCWQLRQVDGKTTWKSLWRMTKWVPDTSSPILIDGRLYLLTEKGILRSLDARTGELIWQERLERAGYRAALVAGDGKLYAVGDIGVTTVIRTQDNTTLSVNSLPEAGFVASPAIAGDCLLLRGRTRLYCVEGADKAEAV